MPNPDSTRQYWQDYRAGRYDALLFGVIAIGDIIKQRNCTSGYIAGVQSIETLAKRAKKGVNHGNKQNTDTADNH